MEAFEEHTSDLLQSQQDYYEECTVLRGNEVSEQFQHELFRKHSSSTVVLLYQLFEMCYLQYIYSFRAHGIHASSGGEDNFCCCISSDICTSPDQDFQAFGVSAAVALMNCPRFL